MSLAELTKAIQQDVDATPDSFWGIETAQKVFARFHPDIRIPVDRAKVDDRSETNIATLLPEVQPYARELVRQAAEQGIVIKITSGTRTCAEQNKLYAKKPPVTRARGGYSNHNFGIAFDVTIFKGTEPVWESPTYKAVGAIGKSLGLEWGGDWNSIVDEPHFQLRPRWALSMSESAMLAQFRDRNERGMSAFT